MSQHQAEWADARNVGTPDEARQDLARNGINLYSEYGQTPALDRTGVTDRQAAGLDHRSARTW